MNFGGGGITPPVVPTPLHHIGQVNATQNLPANASAKLRVFGRDGADLEGHTLAITGTNGARDTWLGQLATLVNSRSAYVRVGNLQGGSVTVPSQATVLQVYALTETSGVSYVVDIALPPTPPVTPPGGPEWTEGAHYKTGEVVSYKGGNYVCLQGHQALVGAGWYPDAPSVINVLWKRQ
ncbi:N-acetylglucosamine binding protein domain 2 [compost metagenome]